MEHPELEHRRATPNLLAFYSIRSVPRRAGNGPECDLSKFEPSGTFGYQESNTSTSEIELLLAYDGCCDCVPVPWRDEIIIERLTPAGSPEGIVWRGTVTQVIEDTFGTPTLRISVRDNSVWWGRRPNARSGCSGTFDQAVLWRKLVLDAEQGDPSGVIIGPAELTGLRVEGNYEAASATTLGGDIRTAIFGGLADVFWSVIDRDLYGPGPFAITGTPHSHLDIDQHWVEAGAVIDTDGFPVASQVRILFTDPDTEETVVGQWPPSGPVIDPTYGLHIKTLTSEVEATATQLQAMARRQYERDREPHQYLVTSSDSLSPVAPVTIWDLRPGRFFTVSSEDSCSPVIQSLFRVYGALVAFEGSGDGRVRESRVAVDMGPAGVAARSVTRVSI